MSNYRSSRLHRLSSRLILIALIVASVLSRSGLAQVSKGQTASETSGTLVELKVPAPALKGNLLGDPLEQPAAVYLPPGYDRDPTKRYPTVYLLHGFGANIQMWTGEGKEGLNLRTTMDDLIRKGTIREMIVVVPNGKNAYEGSFYTNSEVTGNWADFISKDLVSYIDGHYRTLSRVESRGIAGHSMGGYGATVLAMTHPEVFTAAYALSPCCLTLEWDYGFENPAWLKAQTLTSKEQLPKDPKNFEEFWTEAFVALAAAFSPNPQKGPFFADFPYEVRGGGMRVNESAYAKWRQKIPVYMVEAYRQNLMKLKGIYIDVGQNDEFAHIRNGSRQFSEALGSQRIPHVFELYKGGNHGNMLRQRLEQRVFPFFSSTLNFDSEQRVPSPGK